ncbi:hypothetical protein NE237_026547 [Protea cynaroides]|uniref:Uncharacterized protein n=1 Tax=Protea cynaroides TaxID=273540 RepID=A0A9Q0H3Y7_9MAGN|nr:hypothetical protein NE237_026547 [Protea cynaroides]
MKGIIPSPKLLESAHILFNAEEGWDGFAPPSSPTNIGFSSTGEIEVQHFLLNQAKAAQGNEGGRGLIFQLKKFSNGSWFQRRKAKANYGEFISSVQSNGISTEVIVDPFQSLQPLNISWHPHTAPPLGIIKINTDSSRIDKSS